MWELKKTFSDQPSAISKKKEEDAAAWVREHLRFAPDPMQAQVLRTKSKRGLLNCCRQWGKSTVTAAKAVHRAHCRPGSLTLVVSPSARQSGEFLRKATEFARRLGIRPKGDGDNEISLELPNGSESWGYRARRRPCAASRRSRFCWWTRPRA